MSATYFKRYRMERELADLQGVAELPPEFAWVPWGPGLIEAHAQVLFQSFHDSLDSVVFPNLGQQAGCIDLMRAIASRSHFVPEATWLIVGPCGPCGSVKECATAGTGRFRTWASRRSAGVVAWERSFC